MGIDNKIWFELGSEYYMSNLEHRMHRLIARATKVYRLLQLHAVSVSHLVRSIPFRIHNSKVLLELVIIPVTD
jgi:hypothetical protein